MAAQDRSDCSASLRQHGEAVRILRGQRDRSSRTSLALAGVTTDLADGSAERGDAPLGCQTLTTHPSVAETLRVATPKS